MPNSPHIPKLPNPPLQEVIFEVKWRLLSEAQEQREIDPEYETALGLLKKKLQKRFPDYERLVLPPILPRLPAYNIGHRFWGAGKAYPLIQYGPGILAVNETDKNYQWKTNYFPAIRFALTQLLHSYEKSLIFVEANLRYIDSTVLSEKEKIDLPGFLDRNLQTSIQKKFKVPGSLSDINITEFYTLSDDSQLQLDITSGVRNPKQERVIIWQNSVFIRREMNRAELEKWLTQAHKISSGLFKKMVSKEFFETFKHEK